MPKEASLNYPRLIQKFTLEKNNLTTFVWDEKIFQAKFVDLSRNRITKFILYPNPEEASQTIFNLNQNFLQELHIDIEELHADDNFTFKIDDSHDFDCSFVLNDVIRNYEVPQLKFNFGWLRCQTPKHLNGRLVRDLTAEDVITDVTCEIQGCSCFSRDMDKSLFVNCSSKLNTQRFEFADSSLRLIDFFEDIGTRLNDQKSSRHDSSRKNEIGLNFRNFRVDIGDRTLEILPVTPENFQFKVTEIYAPNNLIEDVEIKNLGDHLQVLDLRNNKLKTLNDDLIKKLKTTRKLFLGGNPWICGCSILTFFNHMKRNDALVDHDNIICSNLNQTRLADVDTKKICIDWTFVITIFGACFGVVCAITALFYKFKKDIKIFLYHSPIYHNLCFGCVSEEELNDDKMFDAFVCFADLDHEIASKIINELENGPGGFKCLVGVRDWIAGQTIPELVILVNLVFSRKKIEKFLLQISTSVEQSRRTIVFITKNFLNSNWCRHEFRVAQIEALNQRQSRVIVITYGNIEASDEIDEELKSYLRMHLYIKYEDPRFWQKLCYAMPKAN